MLLVVSCSLLFVAVSCFPCGCLFFGRVLRGASSCSLAVVRCFLVRCLLFVVCCLLLLVVVCDLLFVFFCLLVVV